MQDNTASTPSAASRPRAVPTRKPTWCRSWCAPAFGNNNVDTCARVCHSPTGYGLKSTLGESAGTQDFDSIEQTDVVLVMGANPTDAHPVFGSQMKQRLRQGAKLIVIDPRGIDLVRTPHVKADYHLKLRPGTNVAMLNALAHVIVTEGLVDEAFVAARCETEPFEQWRAFVAQDRYSPEAMEAVTGVPAEHGARRGAACTPPAAMRAIYYGLGVTEHAQGSTAVMGIANLAMATGNIGREGVGVNPMRGQNNVQGSCDMGSFPHEFPGYRHVGDRRRARAVRGRLGRAAAGRTRPAHSEHVRGRAGRQLQGPVHRGRGHRPVRSEHPARHRGAAARWNASWCRTCSSTKRPSTRTCSCPAARSWKRTAPSPMPSVASRACAR